MSKRISDSERIMKFAMTADISEVRQTLDLARVVLMAREGVGPRRVGKPRKAKTDEAVAVA